MLQLIHKDLETTIPGLCETIIRALSDVLKIQKETFASKLKYGYTKALTNDFMNGVRHYMEFEYDESNVQDILYISNELWKLDSLVKGFDIHNIRFYEVTSVNLEKWIINL